MEDWKDLRRGGGRLGQRLAWLWHTDALLKSALNGAQNGDRRKGDRAH